MWIPDPGWPGYRQIIEGLKRRPLTYPLVPDEPFWGSVFSAVEPKAKVMIINSPHNPTGSILDATALFALSERPDLTIVLDESYEGIVFDDRQHPGAVTAPDLAARTVIVRSFSKTFSAASIM